MMAKLSNFVNGKAGPWIRLLMIILALTSVGAWLVRDLSDEIAAVRQSQKHYEEKFKQYKKSRREDMNTIRERLARMEEVDKRLRSIDSRLDRQGSRIESIYDKMITQND